MPAWRLQVRKFRSPAGHRLGSPVVNDAHYSPLRANDEADARTGVKGVSSGGMGKIVLAVFSARRCGRQPLLCLCR